MRRSRAPSIAPGTFFVVQSWADCITNMPGFNLRQALVVAPGFIDLHAHGQSIPADRMQAFDGVTTTLDLEAGVLPVASWYRRQATKGRVLNYGASANWAFARIGAMTGSNAESSLEGFGNAMRDRRWVENVASDTEVAGILPRCRRAGIDCGVSTGGGA